MLMVLSVDARRNFGAPGGGLFGGMHGVCVQLTGKLDFEFVCAVKRKGMVEAVLVVCSSDNLRNEPGDYVNKENHLLTIDVFPLGKKHEDKNKKIIEKLFGNCIVDYIECNRVGCTFYFINCLNSFSINWTRRRFQSI